MRCFLAGPLVMGLSSEGSSWSRWIRPRPEGRLVGLGCRAALSGLALVLAPTVVFTAPEVGGAQENGVAAFPAVEAARIPDGTDVRIDGHLNEEAWSLAEPITDFRQQDPVEGGPLDAVAQAFESLDGTDAMVLDLRAVPGGNAQMANFIVSHFLPPNVLSLYAVSQATGDTTSHVTLSEVPGPRRLDVPVYVLVNGGSVSAAEHVPFVLQNFERATIVGERTPGAGRNNVWFPAELGLRVSLSTTRVYDPLSGGGWERIGVLPDIATSSEEALSAALAHARDITRGTPTVP